MNLLKKYFLFISRAPFMCAWFETFIPTAIGLMYFITFCEKTGKGAEYFTGNFYLGLLITVGIFLVLGFINYGVAKSKITTLSLKENELVLINLINRKVEIYKKPKWGKYSVTRIKLPSGWFNDVKKGDEQKFYTEICLRVNSEVRLFVPITINFLFSGPFDADGLEKTLTDSYELDFVVADNFIEQTFRQLNLFEQNFNGMNADAKSYYNNSMSKNDFTLSILEAIKFPKKLFSNVEVTEVSVGKPKFNYSTLLTKEV